MGFLDSFKKKDVEVKEEFEIDDNFAVNVVMAVKQIAEGKVKKENLTQEQAIESIDIGLCNESFLNTLCNCLKEDKISLDCDSLSDEELLATEFIKFSRKLSVGGDYFLTILASDDYIRDRNLCKCISIYETAIENFNATRKCSILSKERVIKEEIDITDALIDEMRSEILKNDSVSDNILKFVWGKMPSSIRDIDDPVGSILSYIKSL